MISCDFAPNEELDDAWLSLKLLFQPWRWKKGNELELIKEKITEKFSITLFLTGRSALYHLLKSLHYPKGSEVITQGFTCEAVVLPIVANHLRPIYADIETQSYSLNPIEVENKITKNTRVIILQHSFGIPPKFRERIQTIARQRRLLLIEDIAHGFSNLKFQISNSKTVFLMSFGRSKAISSIFGGAVVSNDSQLMRKLNNDIKNLSQPSYLFIIRTLFYKPLTFFIKLTYDIYLGKIFHKFINFLQILPAEITKKEKKGEFSDFLDKAYPNALAILLLNQLNKFDHYNKQRAKICQFYNKQFSSFEFRVLSFPLLRYPLLVKNRTTLLQKAKKHNFILGQWYNQPVAPEGLDLTKVGYKIGSCPVAEKICKQIINLPTLISINNANRVLLTLNDVVSVN